MRPSLFEQAAKRRLPLSLTPSALLGVLIRCSRLGYNFICTMNKAGQANDFIDLVFINGC